MEIQTQPFSTAFWCQAQRRLIPNCEWACKPKVHYAGMYFFYVLNEFFFVSESKEATVGCRYHTTAPAHSSLFKENMTIHILIGYQKIHVSQSANPLKWRFLINFQFWTFQKSLPSKIVLFYSLGTSKSYSELYTFPTIFAFFGTVLKSMIWL